MGFVEDVAQKWAAQEDADAGEEAWRAHRSKARAKVAYDAASDGEDVDERISDEEALEVATFAVTWVDVGVTKLFGKAYAQSAEDKATLIGASAPMAKKYVPADFSIGSLDELIPVEIIFFGAILVIYVPKYFAGAEAEEAAKKNKPPEKEVHGQVTERKLSAVP